MKKLSVKKMSLVLAAIIVMLLAFSVVSFAADDDLNTAAVAAEDVETTEDNATGMKALGSGIAIGIAAGFGALAMGLAVKGSAEGVARQPEASGKIQTVMMLGLVFIETAIIYALIVAILIVFVL